MNDSSVIEFRDKSWWSKASLIELEKLKYTVCSVDAPLLPKRILNFNGIIYLRLHGSKSGYNYLYSEKELKNIIKRLQKISESKKSIFLNNDHGMHPKWKIFNGKDVKKSLSLILHLTKSYRLRIVYSIMRLTFNSYYFD